MKPTADDVKNGWNVNCGDLPRCSSLEFGQRRKRAEFLAYQFPDLPRIVSCVKKAAESPFLNGRVVGKDGNWFRTNFSWFCTPENFIRIEEGEFDSPTTIEPPMPAAKEITSYWDQPKPERWNPTDEEFLNCQIAGRLASRGTRYEWASADEIEKARQEVLEMRADEKHPLPKTFDEAVGKFETRRVNNGNRID